MLFLVRRRFTGGKASDMHRTRVGYAPIVDQQLQGSKRRRRNALTMGDHWAFRSVEAHRHVVNQAGRVRISAWHPISHVTMPSVARHPSGTTPPFHKANVDLRTGANASIQTVPELIEYNALHNPDHCFCIQAQKQVQDTGPQLLSVSHRRLKHAIARCQAWLQTVVVRSTFASSNNDGSVPKNAPVALFVESDVGLLIHLFALMGLGVPVRSHLAQRPEFPLINPRCSYCRQD